MLREKIRTAWSWVTESMAVVLGIAVIVVPFSLPVWFLIAAIFPGATIMQQAFAFTLVSIFLIMTGAGALIAWVVGVVFIVAVALSMVWVLLA